MALSTTSDCVAAVTPYAAIVTAGDAVSTIETG